VRVQTLVKFIIISVLLAACNKRPLLECGGDPAAERVLRGTGQPVEQESPFLDVTRHKRNSCVWLSERLSHSQPTRWISTDHGDSWRVTSDLPYQFSSLDILDTDFHVLSKANPNLSWRLRRPGNRMEQIRQAWGKTQSTASALARIYPALLLRSDPPAIDSRC
jgi:hypothetical protein